MGRFVFALVEGAQREVGEGQRSRLHTGGLECRDESFGDEPLVVGFEFPHRDDEQSGVIAAGRLADQSFGAFAEGGVDGPERLVDATVTIVARATPIYKVLRRAAADPEVNALLDENRRRRHHDQRQLIESLADSGHLHRDVNVTSAADRSLPTPHPGLRLDLDQVRSWATALLSQHLTGTAARATRSARRRHDNRPIPPPS